MLARWSTDLSRRRLPVKLCEQQAHKAVGVRQGTPKLKRACLEDKPVPKRQKRDSKPTGEAITQVVRPPPKVS